MQSLRSRSKSQYRPQKLSKSSAPGATKNVGSRKSRVDDKIKKRMSMRYADISAPTGATIPDVPALPAGPGVLLRNDGQRALTESPTPEDPYVIDTEMLQREDFDPEAYLKVKLSNSTEAELRSLQSSLESRKAATASDLQRSVFKNYAEFVLISKEISTLENDMLELKEMLSEWKAMPSLLHIDDTPATERRRANRSSIADLQNLYATQISSLHQRIEGSAKFIPAAAGRHLVSETSNISALNSASYKPEFPAHFILLNDSLLVARRKKRTGGARSEEIRLIADRCWMLSDIVIVDVKDTIELKNVIKVKHGKNGYVYRTRSSADKKGLLSSFRELAEQLAEKRRKEREGEHERRRSQWMEGDRRSFISTDLASMPSLPSWLKDSSGLSLSNSGMDRPEQDARWISDYCDNLSVAIALRQWEEATALVETGEEKSSSLPQLVPKLSSLKSSLVSSLLESLADPSHRKSAVVNLTSLLLRLDAGSEARSTFLATRRELMRKRVRMIRFEGGIVTYISDLTLVVFTGIKHSADWYLGSFREHEGASTFVQWAKEQLQTYAELFRTQVYSSDISPETVTECLQIMRLQSKRLLTENGLDFHFMLDEMLATPNNLRPARPPRVLSLSTSTNSPVDNKGARTPKSVAPPPRSRDRPASGSIAERSPGRNGMI
ncbi:hypothetical protein SISNIDRAFT_550064 [Sistotremastrum niveocremeum HHB9708]|uniref:Exocyst complex component EXO84 n=1 Tax=Sistotremastrum niveocremeum HHB9708 TaxID=1314777 RepID=A0A164UA91_9AGAM|nr:hypothetical protein SISNIDRAFT_550064 [Sistotremastrum niveocremeum HHB9708]